MCAGEWKRHNQKTLFRDYTVADWTDSLQHTKKWIDVNQKIQSKRIVTGKRKRTPEVIPPFLLILARLECCVIYTTK